MEAAVIKTPEEEPYNEEELLRYERLKSEAAEEIADAEELSGMSVDDRDEEMFAISAKLEQKDSPFTSILLLPFNVVWRICLDFCIIFQCSFIVIIFGLHTKKNPKTFRTTIRTLRYLTLCDMYHFTDFVLMITYKLRKKFNRTKNMQSRPWWSLSLDVVGMLPLDIIYYAAKGGNPNLSISELLMMNRLLRQNFIWIYFVKTRTSIPYQSTLFRLWAFVTTLIAVCNLFVALLCIQSGCNFEKLEGCNDTWTYYFVNHTQESGDAKYIALSSSYDWYWIGLYVIVGKITTQSLGAEFAEKSISELVLYISTAFASILIHIVIVITPLTLIIVSEKQTIFEYAHKLKIIIKYLREQNVDEDLVAKVKNSYEICWVKRRGVGNLTLPDWLANVTKRSVYLDLYWNAFKHSHLFRDMDVPFLRFMSIYFTNDYFMPGDVIYAKNDLKSKMIYIVSGVIQVLSEEDNMTPIISFSGGTLLGETTLVLSYPSTTILRCATYTELYILERSFFCLELRNYPKHQRAIFRHILQRFAFAKELNDLARFNRKRLHTENHPTEVGWLKRSVNELLAEVQTKRKRTTRELDDSSIFNEVEHTVAYLDLYNLPESLELETQRACLTATFPWIMEPGSPFLKVWNMIILIVVVMVTAIIPFNATSKPNYGLCMFVLLLTVLLLIDIYIQMTTAVRTKDGLVMNVRELLYLKFTSAGFLLDLMGSLPIEMIVYMLEDAGFNLEIMATMQLSRIIRFWRVEAFFVKLENEFYIEVWLLRIIKFCLYAFLLIYTTACILYKQACPSVNMCDVTSWAAVSQFASYTMWLPLSFAATLVTGVGLRGVQPTNLRDIWYITVAFIVSSMFFIYMVSGTIASNILAKKTWYAYQELSARILMFMKNRKLDKELERRLVKFLDHEWQHNKGVAITYNGLLSNMSKHLKEEVHVSVCAAYLRRVQLFQDVSNELITRLASVVDIVQIPEEEIVIYAGSVAYELHIILDGYCEVVSSLHKSLNKQIGPKSYFSEIEMCLEVPATDTVRTITNCKLIKLSSTTFKEVTSFYPSLQEEFGHLEDIIAAIKDKARKKVSVQYVELSQINVQTNQVSFFKFGHKLLPDSPLGKDYYRPFNKLKVLQFIRYLLLRVTFMPDGRFLKWWEVSRCCCAIAVAFLYPMHPMFKVTAPRVMWITYVLDLLGIVDMYMRLHVGYYTKEGLLIKHPLKTAFYYVTHSFFLDFLGCMPFEIFIPEGRNKYQDNVRSSVKLLRLIQLHRVIEGIAYLDYSRNVNVIYNMFKYIPILFIVMNVAGAVFVKYDCYMHPDIAASEHFEAGVWCLNISFFQYSDYAVSKTGKLKPYEVYLLAVYFATSCLTRTGLPGVEEQHQQDAILVFFLSVSGLLLMTVIYGLVASSRPPKNPELTFFQEDMRTFVTFMKRRSISKELREELVNYFEVLWKSTRGVDSHEVLSPCQDSLRNDMLFSLYGSCLETKSVFSGSSRTFFLSVLTHTRGEFYLKNLNICKVNNIMDQMYILHRGSVDVRGPHGGRMTILHPGALFGNLKHVKRTRQSVTIMARTHVEVLWIKTSVFYDIMKHYPAIRKRFSIITRRQVDYIPSIPDDAQLAEERREESEILVERPKNVIYPDSKPYKIWELIGAIIGSVVIYFCTTYQFCLRDFSLVLYALNVMFDLIYMARPYLKLKLAYEDDVGEMVTNKKLIRRRYFRSFLGFPMDAVTILPIEFLAFAIANEQSMLFYFSALRLNRMPRILLLHEYFKVRENRLNINVYWMWMINLIVYSIVFAHTVSCFHLVFSCQEWQYNISERIYLYLKGMHEILQISTKTTFYSTVGSSPLFLLYLIVIAVWTQIMGAHSVGEMYSILQVITNSLGRYIRTIKEMKMSLIKNEVSPAVVRRLWEYMCLLWEYQQGQQYPRLLQLAPLPLREKLFTSMYLAHLRMCPVFQFCEEDLLRQIVMHMREMTFFPGTTIVFEGDIDNSMYFIHEGEVNMMKEAKYLDYVTGVLKEGDMFGMKQGLLIGEPHMHSYRAHTRCVVIRLHKEDWEFLLDFYPANKATVYAILGQY